MKKLLLAFMAMILAVCAYANTCTYNGVQVTLLSETVEIKPKAVGKGTHGYIYVTVSDPTKTRVRCQVEYAGGHREWVDIPIKDGQGRAFIGNDANIPAGSYPVKLLQSPGQCY